MSKKKKDSKKKTTSSDQDNSSKGFSIDWKLLLFITFILLLFFWLASFNNITKGEKQTNTSSASKVNGFQDFRLLNFIFESAVISFDRSFKPTLEIESINNFGFITNTEETLNLLINNAGLITREQNSELFEIESISENWKKMSTIDSLRMVKTLKLNLKKGDLLVQTVVSNKVTKIKYKTLNSISTDGRRFSGMLFLTSVEDKFNIIYSIEPNTNCPTITIANYIFTGIPKIQVQVCMRAVCANDSINDCLITKTQLISGPFSSLAIHKTKESDSVLRGEIFQNSCIGNFKYAYTTGFKTVKVSNPKAGTFEVSGILGREFTNGSFSVIDECLTNPKEFK